MYIMEFPKVQYLALNIMVDGSNVTYNCMYNITLESHPHPYVSNVSYLTNAETK